MLNIRGRKCTVAGGGNVAERKVKTLLKYGADVTAVSPVFKDGFPNVKRLEKEYSSSDIENSFLVIAFPLLFYLSFFLIFQAIFSLQGFFFQAVFLFCQFFFLAGVLSQNFFPVFPIEPAFLNEGCSGKGCEYRRLERCGELFCLLFCQIHGVPPFLIVFPNWSHYTIIFPWLLQLNYDFGNGMIEEQAIYAVNQRILNV